MSLYYMPPPPPRPSLPDLGLQLMHHWVDRARERVTRMPRESRLVVVGLVLAQLMVFALYMVLVDNLAQVEKKRVSLEQQAQDRHTCEMISSRLERQQCHVNLRMQDSQVITLAAQ